MSPQISLCRMLVQQFFNLHRCSNCTARAAFCFLAFSDLICLRRLDLAPLFPQLLLHSTLRARIGTGRGRKGERKKIFESRDTNGGVLAIHPFLILPFSKVFTSAGPARLGGSTRFSKGFSSLNRRGTRAEFVFLLLLFHHPLA